MLVSALPDQRRFMGTLDVMSDEVGYVYWSDDVLGAAPTAALCTDRGVEIAKIAVHRYRISKEVSIVLLLLH